MTHRHGNWAIGLCFGGASVLGVLSILSFVGASGIWADVFLLLGGAVLALAGWQVRSGQQQSNEVVVQKASQAELLSAQLDEQRNAVDAMGDGLDIAMFICDHRGTIHYANRRAMELFRFDRPVGRNILEVTLSNELEQLVIAAAKTGAPQRKEISFTYPDERVGLAKTWSIHDSAERVFLSVYEITDLRRLERVRQDFVANVSHELRTPLTIIRSMAETIIDDDQELSKRADRYLNKIIGEVDRLSMISHDLLILSAAESNPVQKQSCDICEVYRGVVQQMEPKAQEKGLNLQFVGPNRLAVKANISQMTQVAINLIDNAINYTATGDINVTVNETDSTLTISVSDTGIGIPSDQVKRIFERFYRVDRARSRATGGTGLGLSIVKHIIEAHGGTVDVESALNHGSTFTITMPTGQ